MVSNICVWHIAVRKISEIYSHTARSIVSMVPLSPPIRNIDWGRVLFRITMRYIYIYIEIKKVDIERVRERDLEIHREIEWARERERRRKREEQYSANFFLCFHNASTTPSFIFHYPFPIFRKKSIPSLLTVGGYTVISYNIYNCWIRLYRLVHREVKIRTYVHTGLGMLKLTSSEQNTKC